MEKARLTDSILSWGVLDVDKKALVDCTLSKSFDLWSQGDRGIHFEVKAKPCYAEGNVKKHF